MQAINKRYHTLAVGFYNFWNKWITHWPTAPHETYALRMVQTHFPKLSYKNHFEPAYTPFQVKYNAHICLTLIAFTLIFTHRQVASEEQHTVHRA